MPATEPYVHARTFDARTPSGVYATDHDQLFHRYLSELVAGCPAASAIWLSSDIGEFLESVDREPVAALARLADPEHWRNRVGKVWVADSLERPSLAIVTDDAGATLGLLHVVNIR